MLIVIGFGGALLALLFIAVLAAFKVDGFHGDKRRDDLPVAAPAAEPAPARQRQPQGPLRVPSRRLDQVEAA